MSWQCFCEHSLHFLLHVALDVRAPKAIPYCKIQYFCCFLVFWLLCCCGSLSSKLSLFCHRFQDEEASQKRLQIDTKAIKNPCESGVQFLMPLGGQHESRNPSKINPKSIQNLSKIVFKIDQIFVCFLSGLWVDLGANMAAKTLPTWAGGEGPQVRVFGLGGLLGLSWGLLGPKSRSRGPKSRFLIDF